jgi:hypothetical protein
MSGSLHKTLGFVFPSTLSYDVTGVYGSELYWETCSSFITQLLLCVARKDENENGELLTYLRPFYKGMLEDIMKYSLRMPMEMASKSLQPALNNSLDELDSLLCDSGVCDFLLEEIIDNLVIVKSEKQVFRALKDEILNLTNEIGERYLEEIVQAHYKEFYLSNSKLGIWLVNEFASDLEGSIPEEMVHEVRNLEYAGVHEASVRRQAANQQIAGPVALMSAITTKSEAYAAMEGSVFSLKSMSQELKADNDFITSLVRVKGEVIGVLRDEYGDDEAMILLSLKTYKEALLHCSERLRDSVSFAQKCIAVRSGSFQFLSEVLRNNYEICEIALKRSKGNWNYLSPELQEDSRLRDLAGQNPLIIDHQEALEILKGDSSCFYQLSSGLQRSSELILLACRQSPEVLRDLETEYWDLEFCISVIQIELSYFKIIPASIRKDEVILRKLVRIFPKLLFELPWKFQKNPDFQNLANWGDFALSQVEICSKSPGTIICYDLNHGLGNNLLFIHAVLKKNGLALEFCSNKIRNDLDLVRVAVNQNPEALRWASGRLQKKFANR